MAYAKNFRGYSDYCHCCSLFSMIKSGEWGLKSMVLGPLFAFGIFHTMNGFKMITDDYVSSTLWRAVLLAIYWIVGVTAAILALK